MNKWIDSTQTSNKGNYNLTTTVSKTRYNLDDVQQHEIECGFIKIINAAKNEKLTSTIAMPISQNIPHFMAFFFKISPIPF